MKGSKRTRVVPPGAVITTKNMLRSIAGKAEKRRARAIAMLARQRNIAPEAARRLFELAAPQVRQRWLEEAETEG